NCPVKYILDPHLSTRVLRGRGTMAVRRYPDGRPERDRSHQPAGERGARALPEGVTRRGVRRGPRAIEGPRREPGSVVGSVAPAQSTAGGGHGSRGGKRARRENRRGIPELTCPARAGPRTT